MFITNQENTSLLFDNLNKAFVQFHEIYNMLSDESLNNKSFSYDFSVFHEAFSQVLLQFFIQPEKVIEKNFKLFNDYFLIMQNVSLKFSGLDIQNIYQAGIKDVRFRDKDWQHNIYFNCILQFYLCYSQWLLNIIDESELNDINKKKARFFAKQYIDALSPSNFIYTNPLVLQDIFLSNGENIVQGLEKLKQDIITQKFPYNIPNNSEEFFHLGKNIASTPGVVLYRNELFELLYYTPTHEKNFEIPVLIIPPCINKYYILDLKPESSIIRWLLDKRFSVFIVSWVNPTALHANYDIEDYVLKGVITAINFILEKFQVTHVNTIGYCIGGTILTIAASYLKKQKKSSINSITLLATLIDFSDSGDLQMFLDDTQIEQIENKMSINGYYDKYDMALAFNLLRSNEMIWQQFINNYLLGKELNVFDILYWNADSTRIPATFHSSYLRNMYLNNNLIKENFLQINNSTINVKDIDIPIYILATSEDHIVPWDGAFNSTKLFDNTKFVLGGSGHVAGVINHPDKNKYYYYINDEKHLEPSQWLNSSIRYEGSWWNNWFTWQTQYSGKLSQSFRINNGNIKIIQDAPGLYVMEK